MPPKKKKLKLEKEDLEKGPSEPPCNNILACDSVIKIITNFTSRRYHIIFCIYTKFTLYTSDMTTTGTSGKMNMAITGEDIVTRSYDLMFQE